MSNIGKRDIIKLLGAVKVKLNTSLMPSLSGVKFINIYFEILYYFIL